MPSNTPDSSSLQKYIGIPYSEPAFNSESKRVPGLHCWELAEKIMIEVFGIKPPIVNYTGPLNKVESVFLIQLASWDHISQGNQKAGDLVLLRMLGYPAHCGVMVSKTSFIHVMPGGNRSSTLEHVTSIQWRNRVLSFHRWGRK